MKFSTQEEYGLRCLLRIGKFYYVQKGFTIPEISKLEGISEHTVAKILRALRLGGFLESERGHIGGYTLSREPKDILISDVLKSLGGKLYDDDYCNSHSNDNGFCVNTTDCTVKSVWQIIQDAVDGALDKLSLQTFLDDSVMFENQQLTKN